MSIDKKCYKLIFANLYVHRISFFIIRRNWLVIAIIFYRDNSYLSNQHQEFHFTTAVVNLFSYIMRRRLWSPLKHRFGLNNVSLKFIFLLIGIDGIGINRDISLCLTIYYLFSGSHFLLDFHKLMTNLISYINYHEI